MGADEDDGTFDTLWQASGLARVEPSRLSPAATITARLAEAAARGDEALASTLAVELPVIETLGGDSPPVDADASSERGSVPHASLPHITLVSDELEEGTGRARGVAPELAELRVVSLLGEGGMGRVLLARQRSLGRDVAVKVLKHETATESGIDALLSEARLSGSLEHPNIVPVHALGRDERGHPVLVMKRVEGVSWKDLLDDPKHAAWENIPGAAGRDATADAAARLDAHLEIFMGVCNALHFAHARGVIHRDVKPDNVLIGSFGEVYVADWGIAIRRGEPARHAMVGTPGYMAPEMLAGSPEKVTPRTDVFLLGATLHEVLTGRLRHEGVSVYEVLVKAYDCAPPKYPPGVPAELGEIVARATERDPAHRYEDARALREAVTEYLRHRGSNALALTATGLLDQLRAAAANPAAADLRAVHRLGSECRFGFAQALREWPGNTLAKVGHRDALVALTRFELARENAEAAGALLDDLGSRAAEYRALRAAHTALCKSLEERRAHDSSLRAMERELDLHVGSSARTRGFAALTVFTTAVSVFSMVRRQQGLVLTYRRMLLAGGLVLIVLMSVVFLGRKTLLQNLANRRIIALVGLCSGTVWVHRLYCWKLGTPPSAVLTVDLLIMGMMVSVGAVAISPWLWSIAGVLVAGSMVVLLADLPPEGSFGLVSTLSFVAGAWSWQRFSAKQKASEPAPAAGTRP